MRTLPYTALAAGMTLGAVLVTAPAATAAPGSVTICAKGPAKSAPASVLVGFTSTDPANPALEGGIEEIANNSCVSIDPALAPSAVHMDADRPANKVVVDTSAGKTVVTNTDQVDFTLNSGESATVTFFFKK